MISSTIRLLLLAALYVANIQNGGFSSSIGKFAQPAPNVALRGIPTQSSTKGRAQNANDGSLANNYLRSQCSYTEEEDGPWWMVDLNKPHKIISVAITNHVIFCCKERLFGAEIRIGNNATEGGIFNPSCGIISSIESGETMSFSCEGMTGQYVTVTIPGQDKKLILCEVQVFGFPASTEDEVTVPKVLTTPNGAPNVAMKGVAQQSSFYNMYGEAKNAIDGSVDSDFFNIHCSTTSKQDDPWWRVNLLKEFEVFTVAVTNRRDCCAERINGAQIRVGNSAEHGGTDNPICGIIPSMEGGETLAFECDGMIGQYVTIYLPGQDKVLTLCEVQVFGVPVDPTGLRGKSLIFPEEGDADYAVIHPGAPLDLTEFTLCLRVSTELPDNREVILFSYFNNGDELNVWRESDGQLSLYLGSSELGAKFYLPSLRTFGAHVCVTWESSSGLTNVWFAGKRSVRKIYRKGHRVIPGGTVILGQDQDKPESSFDAKQSFVGEITDVHLWDYVLLPYAIKEVYEGKSESLGNVINWELVKYKLHGNVVAD